MDTWRSAVRLASLNLDRAVKAGILAYLGAAPPEDTPARILLACEKIADSSPEAAVVFGVAAYDLHQDRRVTDRGDGGICELAWPGGLDASDVPILLSAVGMTQALDYDGC